MKTKVLFLMFALVSLMLTMSCGGNKEKGGAGNNEKGGTTYSFSDGTTLTKSLKGGKVIYKSNDGIIVDEVSENVNGDIVVVEKPNVEKFNDPRRNVESFSAVYNVSLPEPILRFDEYYVGIDLYPQSGLIVAHKRGDAAGSSLCSIRTFDGKMLVFPSYLNSKFIYTDVINTLRITVNGDTGEIEFVGYGHTFTLKDIKPEWIKDNKMQLNFPWYRDIPKSGGEYVPFQYGMSI